MSHSRALGAGKLGREQKEQVALGGQTGQEGQMALYAYVIVNVVLSTLVVAGVVGLLTWSVLTQHRHAGCEKVRLSFRRVRIGMSRAPFEVRSHREVGHPDLAEAELSLPKG
jgi:hypothetical protein